MSNRERGSSDRKAGQSSDRRRKSRKPSKSRKRSVKRTLRRVWSILFKVVSAPVLFLADWFKSRKWRRMAWGILPLVAGFAFCIVIYAGTRIPEGDLIVKYRRAAGREFERDNNSTAELWMSKVAALDPGAPDLQYDLAVSAIGRGDPGRARQIMHRLAPDDAAGYGPAHVWVASDLLAASQQQVSAPDAPPGLTLLPDRADRIRHHLLLGLAADPENTVAREQLAWLEWNQKNKQAAVEQYELLAQQDRRHTYTLAQMHAVSQNPDRARAVAQKGRDHFRRKVENDPDDVESRIQWASLEGFLENFDQAIHGLIAGLQRQPDAATANTLRLQIGKLYLLWTQVVRRDDPENVNRQLNLLEQALQISPEHPGVLEFLAVMTLDESKEGDAARDKLSSSIVDGTATPMVHLLLGMAAFKRDDQEQSEHHYRLALAGNPRLVVATNNLAWRLAHKDDPDPGAALEMIEQAVRQSEGTQFHAEIRATRARIYQLLHRYHEAIQDYEFALAENRDRLEFHTALAELYAQIGNTNLARRHADRVAEIAAEDGPIQ